MPTLLLSVEVLIATVLALTGVSHLAAPGHFADVLVAQGVAVRRPIAATTATIIATAEVAASALISIGLVLGAISVRRVGIGAAAFLFAVFAGQMVRLVRSGAVVTCGCGAGDHSVGLGSVVRAIALFGLSAAALAGAPVVEGGDLVAVALASGLLLAPILLYLPAALSGWGSDEIGGLHG